MSSRAPALPHLEGWRLATEAAADLGISRQAINRWIADGRFKEARRLGSGARPIYVLAQQEVDRMREQGQGRRSSPNAAFIVVRKAQRVQQSHGDGMVHACPDGLPLKSMPITAGRTCQRQIDSHEFEVTDAQEFRARPCGHCYLRF